MSLHIVKLSSSHVEACRTGQEASGTTATASSTLIQSDSPVILDMRLDPSNRTPLIASNLQEIDLAGFLGLEAQSLSRVTSYIQQIEQFITRQGDNFRGLTQSTHGRLTHYRRMAEIALKANPQNTTLSDLITRIKQLQALVKSRETKEIERIDYDELLGHLSQRQKELLFRNMNMIELNTGCSVGCPDCNFSPVLDTRRTLSWQCLERIIDEWGEPLKTNRIALYYASDPLDWEDPIAGKDYFDILLKFSDKTNFVPYTSTAIPRGKEELARELWRSNARIRISLSNSNLSRLKREGLIDNNAKTDDEIMSSLAEHLGPPGNSSSLIEMHGDPERKNHLAIETGQDYDYSRFFASINCRTGTMINPDGAFNFATSWTSPFSPEGHVKFPINSDTKNFFKQQARVYIPPDSEDPYGEVLEDQQDFRPIPVDSIDPEIKYLPKLLDHQCFNAIYGLLRDASFLDTIELDLVGEFYPPVIDGLDTIPEPLNQEIQELYYVDSSKNIRPWEDFYPNSLMSNRVGHVAFLNRGNYGSNGLRTFDYWLKPGLKQAMRPLETDLAENDAVNILNQFRDFLIRTPAARRQILLALYHDRAETLGPKETYQQKIEAIEDLLSEALRHFHIRRDSHNRPNWSEKQRVFTLLTIIMILNPNDSSLVHLDEGRLPQSHEI